MFRVILGLKLEIYRKRVEWICQPSSRRRRNSSTDRAPS